MNKEERNEMITTLKEEISTAGVFYLTDTSSLGAEATSALRRECFKKNVKLRVVKNTLFAKALEQIDGEDYSDLMSTLVGNTSVMYSEIGNVPAKLIKEFRKKHDKPVLKAAYIESECYIGDDQLGTLADIKSKEELLGDIIMLLQSPAKNLISALQGSGGGKIAGLLKAIENK